MEVSEFFLKFLVILVSAKFFAEIFAFLRLPAVLGEVVAGIIIGPSLLGVIQVDATLYLLAEIGILLLLFEVGLETDVGQVVKVGVQSFLVAITGVVAPAVAGFWISKYIFHLPLLVSLFIGGTIVATSIGITIRVLVDIKKHQTKTAKIVLGAAVLDDIIGVVILAILYDFAVKGEVRVMDVSKVLGFIAVFLLLAPVITKLLVPLISKLSSGSKTNGMIPTIIISLILVLAIISHKIGAPGILGSFAAGIALARRFFLPLGSTIDHYSHGMAEKIEKHMKPIIDLFVPVFFVVVGASMNLKVIDFTSVTFWQMAGLLTIIAIVTKMISGLWVKGGLKTKLSTGLAMIPRGEVGLIFAEVGKKSGIFDDLIYAIIVFIVALTTLFAPILLRFFMKGEE
ncbi:MAG: putative Na(+)/H(+) antiporter [Candidatus Jettenia ecosi]|uniref:Putative Na(+)/H(+) antiporter n=1 Tax=Candidatus Jettenia ecosi TaxID=2494326 RepID=A0A533Q735_9BACT|nr:MAG: putative Na(+)/H(+) antiporter [Candidatus Jettenia ecosi]